MRHRIGLSLIGAISSLSAAIEPVDAQKNMTVEPIRTKKSSAIDPNICSVDGEFLFWRPDQNGMTYGLVTNELATPLGSKNKEQNQSSSGGAGFRIGAGYQFGESSTDLSLYWTSFHHHSKGAVSGPVIMAAAVWGAGSQAVIGGSGVGGGKATSRWNIDLDLLEFDMGYRIHFRDRFMLRPYIGVEGGWINQRQKINYHRFFVFDATPPLFPVNATVLLTRDFHGVGPKIGLNGDFAVGWGLGVMGHLATALMYGELETKDRLNSISGKLPIVNTQNQLVPALQTQVGINWKYPLFENGEFYLMVGYEVQYFWDIWRRYSSLVQDIYVPNAGNSNLSLNGLTLQVKLSF